MYNQATVQSPATIANIVCGFDVLGLALETPFDEITLRMVEGPSSITIQNEDEFNLPTQPEHNVMGAALLALLNTLDVTYSCHIVSRKAIRPGSGAGSSAASAAGIVYAANAILNQKFNTNELIEFAKHGEFLASGSRHADNIAPAILGGVALIHSNQPLDIVSLPYPELYIALVHPQIEVKTSDARAIIKQQISLKAAVNHWAHVAALVAGFATKDSALISRALQDDVIEPVRKLLIPHFDLVKSKSLEAGALGGGISGSGPSIFMFCEHLTTAQKVAESMQSIYNKHGIPALTYTTPIAKHGVRLTHLQ
jgi:homoserine kinase